MEKTIDRMKVDKPKQVITFKRSISKRSEVC